MPESPVTFSGEEFALWKHHPVTKVFITYLTDYASALEREALAQWQSGALRLIDEQEMRGRVLTLKELADLPFESISTFYEGEKEV